MDNIYIYTDDIAIVVKFKRSKKCIGFYYVVVSLDAADEEKSANTDGCNNGGYDDVLRREDFAPFAMVGCFYHEYIILLLA